MKIGTAGLFHRAIAIAGAVALLVGVSPTLAWSADSADEGDQTSASASSDSSGNGAADSAKEPEAKAPAAAKSTNSGAKEQAAKPSVKKQKSDGKSAGESKRPDPAKASAMKSNSHKPQKDDATPAKDDKKSDKADESEKRADPKLVTPQEPTFHNARSHDAKATVEIPGVDCVTYWIGPDQLATGNNAVANDAKVKVEARAGLGCKITPGATRVWRNSFVAPKAPEPKVADPGTGPSKEDPAPQAGDPGTSPKGDESNAATEPTTEPTVEPDSGEEVVPTESAEPSPEASQDSAVGEAEITPTPSAPAPQLKAKSLLRAGGPVSISATPVQLQCGLAKAKSTITVTAGELPFVGLYTSDSSGAIGTFIGQGSGSLTYEVDVTAGDNYFVAVDAASQAASWGTPVPLNIQVKAPTDADCIPSLSITMEPIKCGDTVAKMHVTATASENATIKQVMVVQATGGAIDLGNPGTWSKVTSTDNGSIDYDFTVPVGQSYSFEAFGTGPGGGWTSSMPVATTLDATGPSAAECAPAFTATMDPIKCGDVEATVHLSATSVADASLKKLLVVKDTGGAINSGNPGSYEIVTSTDTGTISADVKVKVGSSYTFWGMGSGTGDHWTWSAPIVQNVDATGPDDAACAPTFEVTVDPVKCGDVKATVNLKATASAEAGTIDNRVLIIEATSDPLDPNNKDGYTQLGSDYGSFSTTQTVDVGSTHSYWALGVNVTGGWTWSAPVKESITATGPTDQECAPDFEVTIDPVKCSDTEATVRLSATASAQAGTKDNRVLIIEATSDPLDPNNKNDYTQLGSDYGSFSTTQTVQFGDTHTYWALGVNAQGHWTWAAPVKKTITANAPTEADCAPTFTATVEPVKCGEDEATITLSATASDQATDKRIYVLEPSADPLDPNNKSNYDQVGATGDGTYSATVKVPVGSTHTYWALGVGPGGHWTWNAPVKQTVTASAPDAASCTPTLTATPAMACGDTAGTVTIDYGPAALGSYMGLFEVVTPGEPGTYTRLAPDGDLSGNTSVTLTGVKPGEHTYVAVAAAAQSAHWVWDSAKVASVTVREPDCVAPAITVADPSQLPCGATTVTPTVVASGVKGYAKVALFEVPAGASGNASSYVEMGPATDVTSSGTVTWKPANLAAGSSHTWVAVGVLSNGKPDFARASAETPVTMAKALTGAACESGTLPTTGENPAPSGTTTTGPTATTTATTSSADAGTLPYTGFDSMLLMVMSAVAVGLGALFVAAARRRRHGEELS